MIHERETYHLGLMGGGKFKHAKFAPGMSAWAPVPARRDHAAAVVDAAEEIVDSV
jgi:hypothetical protein